MDSKHARKYVILLTVASLFAFVIGIIAGTKATPYAHEEQLQQVVETEEVTDVILTQQADDVEEKIEPIVIIFFIVYVAAIVLCSIGLFVVKRRKNNAVEQREKQLESEETVNDK